MLTGKKKTRDVPKEGGLINIKDVIIQDKTGSVKVTLWNSSSKSQMKVEREIKIFVLCLQNNNSRCLLRSHYV